MKSKDWFEFKITRTGCRVWVEVEDVDYCVGRNIAMAHSFIRAYCGMHNGARAVVFKEIKTN